MRDSGGHAQSISVAEAWCRLGSAPFLPSLGSPFGAPFLPGVGSPFGVPFLAGVGSPFRVASSRRAPLHLARAVSGPCSASHRQMDLDWQSEKTVILKLPLSCSIKSWKERRSQLPETDHLAILPRDRSWSSSRWSTRGDVNGLLLCVHFAC